MELHPFQPETYIRSDNQASAIANSASDFEWCHDLVEHSHDLLCVHDLQGRLLSVNPLPARLLGYTVEEMLMIPMQELVAPEFREQFDAYLDEIQRIGEARGFLAVMTRLGKRRIWEYHNTLRTEGVSSPIVRGVAHDVTEWKQAERALRTSERRFRIIYEKLPVGVCTVETRSGRFRNVNPKFCEIVGRTEEDLLRSDVRTVSCPDDTPQTRQKMRQLADGEVQQIEIEKRFLRPDGSIRWARVSAVRIAEEWEDPVLNMAIVQDITEQKQAEEAVTTIVKRVRGDSSEAFFSSMACCLATSLAADHAIIGELIDGGEEAVKTLAVCGRGEVLDNFVYKLANTPCAQVVNRGVCSYASGVAGLFPDDLLLKEMKIEGYVGTPLFGAQGQTIGIMVALYSKPLPNPAFAETILQLFSARTGAEIERKRSEEALRQSEERMRVALKNSALAVSHQDRDLRYTWLYKPALGWTDQNFIGKTDGEILGEETAASLTKIKKGVLESGVGTRTQVPISCDGKNYHFDLIVEPLTDSAGSVTGLTCAATDVTPLHEVNEELRIAKEKLTEEKFYLEHEINSELGFTEIVGNSDALMGVMGQVAKVASSDSTVLLSGETGTGKELIARAIHRLSQRNDSGFIKMNCAAIPSELFESELFGHEKGSFTGAVARKVGRLELADKGTLFLDEIGEIPLALQPKLLRVLQDQEFERLGSNQTLKVDFRLIAATNQDLFRGVQEKRFRSDLFYRLNVFPIHIPLLRERRTDIPLLAEFFVRKYALRMKKSITSIPQKTMDALIHWDWPGNVRELENFMERSVILTYGSVLAAPVRELAPVRTQALRSLELVEREHILGVLRESRGQLGGVCGAAARLGLHRTTLQSKLKQLGIDHRLYRNG